MGMTETVHDFSHFVVQTLVSETWRTFDRYEGDEDAQDIARKLIPEWGALRVRILGGYFDPLKNRNVYHLVEITEAPEIPGILSRINASKLVLGGSAASGAVLAVVMVLYAVVSPFASFADDGNPEIDDKPVTERQSEAFAPEETTVIAAITAPSDKPVDLRERFEDVAALPYGKILELETVPLRLQGPWSTACESGAGTLIIGEHDLDRSAGSGYTTPLNAVWQSGQRYGLVLQSGSVFMVDMISADQIQRYGTMTRSGEFIADLSGTILKRCL